MQTLEGWRPVKLRSTYSVLGAPPEIRVLRKTVPRHGKSAFVLVFSRRFFEVEVGQRLRVLIDAWPDEQAMESGAEPIQLVSPLFECPESGTGH